MQYLPNHGLEEPGPVSDGRHRLVHQRMHLDEVECVVWKLIGHLVPLHGWSAGTVARPNEWREGGGGSWRGGGMIREVEKRKKNGVWKKRSKWKEIHKRNCAALTIFQKVLLP